MELVTVKNIIEAILFSAGEPVLISKIGQVLEMDEDTVISVAQSLADDYDYNRRGLKIVRLDDSFQMCSRQEYFEYVQKVMETKRVQFLSQASMEVLAIVAYNQPITRAMIEKVRGVDSSQIVSKLLERGLIEESGRLSAPGKPMTFSTTKEFLRVFSLNSLNDLPNIENFELPNDVDENQLSMTEVFQ